MRFIRPKGRLAGFHVAAGDLPGGALLEAGELWTPGRWKIADHAHPGWELYYQAAGETEWRFGRLKQRIGTGGYYLVGPGSRHQLLRFLSPQAHFYYAVFRPERLLTSKAPVDPRSWPASTSAAAGGTPLEGPLKALVRELVLAREDRPYGIDLQLQALCLEIQRLLRTRPPPEPALSAHPAALRVRELFESRPGHPWKLDELAALAGVSIPHLICVFKAEFGAPPHRYLRNLRLDRAAEALQTSDRSVTDIAHDLGFSSSQHLAGSFQRRFGKSPSRHRSQPD
ncbi:MAG: AraC family transcriptional regulator [Puniceicoccaceae bacterium]|nr:MAG: AraC family transcriptional regulator [Puniceicoccaceae bacterium]